MWREHKMKRVDESTEVEEVEVENKAGKKILARLNPRN